MSIIKRCIEQGIKVGEGHAELDDKCECKRTAEVDCNDGTVMYECQDCGKYWNEDEEEIKRREPIEYKAYLEQLDNL